MCIHSAGLFYVFVSIELLVNSMLTSLPTRDCKDCMEEGKGVGWRGWTGCSHTIAQGLTHHPTTCTVLDTSWWPCRLRSHRYPPKSSMQSGICWIGEGYIFFVGLVNVKKKRDKVVQDWFIHETHQFPWFVFVIAFTGGRERSAKHFLLKAYCQKAQKSQHHQRKKTEKKGNGHQRLR